MAEFTYERNGACFPPTKHEVVVDFYLFIYYSGQQNEVILQLPQNTDLGPLFDEHRWPEFLKRKPTNSSSIVSYILENNYTVNGKPNII